MSRYYSVLIIFVTAYLLVLLSSVSIFQLLNIFIMDYDEKRLVQIVILGLTLLGAIFCSQTQPQFNEARWALLAIFVIGLFATFFVPSPKHVFLECTMLIGLWCYTLFVVQLVRAHHHQITLKFALLLLIGAGIYLASIIVGYIAAYSVDVFINWFEIFRGYNNVRFFNQFQIWTLPFLTLIYILKPYGLDRWKRIVFIAITGWWMLLFVSGSKGALLTVLLASGLTWLVYRPIASQFIRSQAVFLISGFIAFFIFFELLPFLLIDQDVQIGLLRQTEGSVSTRFTLWLSAIEMIKDKPILGVGPMHFAWFPNMNAHPHNSLLQWAAEWGLPALAIVLYLFSYGIRCWLKTFSPTSLLASDKETQLIPIALFCSLMSGLGYSLVSGVIVMPMSQIMMVIVIGLMMGEYSNRQVTVEVLSISIAWFWRAIYAFTLCVLISVVWPDFIARLAPGFEPDSAHHQALGARFWYQGGIPHNE